MGEIFVIVEHRKDEIRDITFEMLWKANEVSQKLSYTLTAVIIGSKIETLVNELAPRADKVIVVEDEQLKEFNSELYKTVLQDLMDECHPFLTLIGHTSWGMEIGPSLSVKTGFPLATDCLDIMIEDDDRPIAIRQMYSGKIYSKVSFRPSDGYILTVRPGAFPPDRVGEHQGEIVKREVPDLPEPPRHFVEFIDTGAGEVDISQAELLVSVGRGIENKENLSAVKELADLLGGVISCSRPVVDKNWLPKYHQVGTSGKSVKAKVYLALGISGAFQHIAGITRVGTVIAVNKDPNAPIFRVADYAVVADLFEIVASLKEKLRVSQKVFCETTEVGRMHDA
nr:electron transfer flavoprotein subunit alpha/FixB family protein [Desulfobacterales bacterium]